MAVNLVQYVLRAIIHVQVGVVVPFLDTDLVSSSRPCHGKSQILLSGDALI